MDKREWYGVKCLFQHDGLAQGAEATIYEERVVILRATDFDDAIAQGEAEARQYCADFGNGKRIRYAGFLNAYHTGETKLTEPREVYSLMRETTLSREEFITRYYDDGTERTQ